MVMFFLPVKYHNVYGYLVTQYDIGVFLISLVMFTVILFSIVQKGVELDRIDRKGWRVKM